MSAPSPAPTPLSPVLVMRPRRSGISPWEALTAALDDTVQLLFRPFDGWRWLRLSLACLFLGGGAPTAALNWGLGAVPADFRLREAVEVIQQYLASHSWLIILSIVLGLGLGIVLLYLRAVFRFVLIDALVSRRVMLRRAWKEVEILGRSYFFWLFSALAIAGASIAIVAILAFPFMRIGVATGNPSLTFSLLVAAMLAAVVLAGLGFALVVTLTDDLTVPIMYGGRERLASAWRTLLRTMRRDAASFVAYLLLRFVVAVAVGAAVVLLLVPALMGLFSGAIIVGALVILTLHFFGLAWVWNPLTVLLSLLALVVVLSLLIILLSVVSMPGQVLIQDLGLRFIAPRVPSLEALLVPDRRP